MSIYLYEPNSASALNWTIDGLIPAEGNEELKGALLLVMGNAVNSVKVEMPIKQPKQIMKALPFALEDKLAAEVEENHIVYTGSKSGDAYALVVDHALMEELSELGLKSATSFGAVLPIEKGKATIAVFNDTFYIKTSDFYSGCLPVKLLTFSLEQLRKDESIGDELLLIEMTPLDELQRAELTNLGFNLHERPAIDLLNLASQGIDKALNLLTGIYKPKQIKTNKQPFKFKAPIAMAASFLLVAMVGLGIQTKQTEAKVDAVKTASIDYYKKLFPGERVREKAFKRQFREAVGEGGASVGDSSFTSLLAKSTLNLKDNKNIQLDAVRFNKNKSILELNLIAGNVGQLEKLKTELMAKNLSVEIASANQSGGKIKGLIKVKSNG